MDTMLLIFKDAKRMPLRFISRVYHVEGASSWWYIYIDRISAPVTVKDSEILRVERS